MSERALHARVRGRVQGVGFRWFVRERAVRLGLRGWVRNLEDGAVELMVAGDAQSLDLLRSALRKGPEGARVDEVQELEPPALDGLPAGFRIER